MLDLALVGFRYIDTFKVFKVDQGNASPERLGNKFAMQIAKSSSYLVNDKQSYNFFRNIYLAEDNDKSNDYFINRFLPEAKVKIANQDFGFIYFNVGGRGRFSGPVVIPNDNSQLIPLNLQRYKWVYVYNFVDKRIEFYGRDFPIKEKIESPIDMPYYASINVNFAAMVTGFQKNFDVIQFLPRNHEQEILLQKSINEVKPHKHKEDRKKPKRSYY